MTDNKKRTEKTLCEEMQKSIITIDNACQAIIKVPLLSNERRLETKKFDPYSDLSVEIRVRYFGGARAQDSISELISAETYFETLHKNTNFPIIQKGVQRIEQDFGCLVRYLDEYNVLSSTPVERVTERDVHLLYLSQILDRKVKILRRGEKNYFANIDRVEDILRYANTPFSRRELEIIYFHTTGWSDEELPKRIKEKSDALVEKLKKTQRTPYPKTENFVDLIVESYNQFMDSLFPEVEKSALTFLSSFITGRCDNDCPTYYSHQLYQKRLVDFDEEKYRFRFEKNLK